MSVLKWSLLLAVIVPLGCSHEAKEVRSAPPVPAAPPAAPPVAAAPKVETGPRTIHRADLSTALRAGLGAFLRHVELEERPVFGDGGFLGFRVHALVPPEDWRGVDLRPGDVLLSVNGSSVERPEQALQVFAALSQAKEIRVAFMRDGKRTETVVPIVE